MFSMMSQEHAYCLAIERLLGYTHITPNCFINSILFDEITRVLNHMFAVVCHALDIGHMSAILSFWRKEKLMEFYERVSGARIHAA